MIKSKFQFQEVKISVRKRILKGRNINNDGYSRVYIEITSFQKNGKPKFKRIPTKIWVKPQHWNSKKNDGEITNKDNEHIEKNNIINGVYADYINQLQKRELGTWKNDFNPKHLILLDDLFPSQTKYLIDFINDYIQFRKRTNTKYNTIKGFVTTKNRLINFEKSQQCKLIFEDINLSFSDNFHEFLLKEGFGSGTIQKTYTQLITILNYFFERKDELKINLSDKFRSKLFKRGVKAENDPHPLSMSEFNALVKHDFKNDFLNLTRKRFLLQCSTGMRYSDVFTIVPEMIIESSIVYYPQKTEGKKNNKVEVPLNPISKDILEELEYDSRKLYVSNQKYNDAIENMFEKLKTEYPKIKFDTYSSHDARDTFISYLIESGVDVPTILKIVGQTEYSTLRKYFKNSQSHITKSMKKVKAFKL